MLYIRKVNEIRWRNPHFYDADILSDLATDEHGISVWSANETDEEEIEKAKLAIILARDDFKECFFVTITDKELHRIGIKVTDQEGQTRYKKMKDKHKNIMLYTVCDMLKVAYIIKRKISKSEIDYVTVDEEHDIFDKLVKQGELKLEQLESKKYTKRFNEVKNATGEN